jgi:hypothetical protein
VQSLHVHNVTQHTLDAVRTTTESGNLSSAAALMLFEHADMLLVIAVFTNTATIGMLTLLHFTVVTVVCGV